MAWNGDHLARSFVMREAVMTAATNVTPATRQQLCSDLAGIGFWFWHGYSSCIMVHEEVQGVNVKIFAEQKG